MSRSQNYPLALSLGLFILGLIAPATAVFAQETSPEWDCGEGILSRLQSHTIAQGETLPSIAAQYGLLPETLVRLNPILGQSFPVGQNILIPPFNGVRLEVPTGATWKDLEKAYGVRADVLFEINGCQEQPTVVFVPGVSWSPTQDPRQENYTGLGGYPLPAIASSGMSYGWQENPATGESIFHSGIDLLASPGTPVLAAAGGTVLFVGNEGPYGMLIVIDHGGNRQTRYAHLSRFGVEIGQSVNTGDVIGAVGVTGKPDITQPHLHFEVRYRLPIGWVAQDPMLHFQVK